MKIIKGSFSWCLCLLFSITSIQAQTYQDTTALSEVVLLGTPIRNSLQKTTVAVALVSEKEINTHDGTILTPILNKIPGVQMQQGAWNTNRITIRGMGARAQFGTNRIKAYFENIPITTADGETTIDDIEMDVLGRIEVIKGPNANSFGAGLGGVIHLFGNQNSNDSGGKWTSTFGSFGLQKNSFTGKLNDKKTQVLLNYSHLQNDGFRANSQYERQTINLLGNHQISPKGKFNFVAIATRLKAFIPSSINENDFINQPEIAAANWAAAQGYESYDKILLGLGYQHQFSAKWQWNHSFFGNFKKAYEPRPFDILDDQTSGIGVRSQIQWNDKIGTFPSKINLGTEGMQENYRFTLFENLYQSQPGQGSVEGNPFDASLQKRGYLNLFVQLETQLTSKLNLESGISWNRTLFRQKNTFQTENQLFENNQFPDIWSPRLAFSYQIKSGIQVFTSMSQGFSTPSLAETLTPERQLNQTILPEIGTNYEIGYKGSFLKNKLYTELTFYRTQIKNLLVAQRIAEDQFVGLNAGESLHQGVEMMMNYVWKFINGNQLKSQISGTFNRFEFVEFSNNDENFSGNKLPGTPESQWNISLDYQTKSGFNLNASLLKMGSMLLNDANTLKSDSYQLLDVKCSYTTTFFEKLQTQFSFGIQNSLDEKYAANVLPNAVGFGNAQPRYFYPGSPRNFYGSLSLRYQL